MLDRRTSLRAGLALLLVAGTGMGCGGGTSRLITVKRPTGSGDVDFQVQNKSDVAVNNLYLAKTETVDKALAAGLEPNSPAEAELWGSDRLSGSALEQGGRQKIKVDEPGRWDVRAVDRDGRYQHVSGLRIEAGGKYILELVDGSWRVDR